MKVVTQTRAYFDTSLVVTGAYGVTPDAGPGKFSDLRKINDAPELFASHGYDWVGSPWTETANVVAWGKSLRSAVSAHATLQLLVMLKSALKDCSWLQKAAAKHGHAMGLVDTEWGDDLPAEKWGNIPNVSACSWNLEGFLASAPAGV
jgi:hypothetical protein